MAKTKAQLDQEIQAALEPIRVDWAKVMFWKDKNEAVAVAADKGWPQSVVVKARTAFHEGYALKRKGKLLSRAAYERTLPPVPKEKMFYIQIERDGRSTTVSEHQTITEAKAAAKQLVQAGEARVVDVYHLGPGGRYLQGVVSAEGWSRV